MSIFDEMERDAVALQRLPTEGESKNLTKLALELIELDARLAKYAEVAATLGERRNQLAMKILPDAMIDVGQDVIGMGDQGVDLKLSDYCKAGLPNPDTAKSDEERVQMAALREAGIEFLTRDSPDILTTTIVVTLPKGNLEKARSIRDMLTSQQGYDIEPSRVKVEEGVHWGTLTSYVKEQVVKKERTDLPLAALGATVGKIVKIQKRKTK